MSKTTRKHTARPGYEVGSRPPRDLSEKAAWQLKHTKVSSKLMSMVEKAGSAKVSRVDGTPRGAASKTSSSNERK